MVRFLLFLWGMGCLAGCLQPKKPKPEPDDDVAAKEEMRNQLMEADRRFSRMCMEKGYKMAFLDNIDSNGVLLRPDMVPVIGADAVDYLSQQSDGGFTMTWDPRGGSVAASGDMGYTFGLYSIKPSAGDTVIYGTYVNIWKRQADGTWKFVLDSGNEGIGDIQ